MEILLGLAVAIVINGVLMAQVMRWQANRIRSWPIKLLESLSVQARASLVGGVCALFVLLALSFLPLQSSNRIFGLEVLAFFVPYYHMQRYSAYELTKHQRDRGRGVARRHVKDIANATFLWVLGVYGMFGMVIFMVLRMANSE